MQSQQPEADLHGVPARGSGSGVVLIGFEREGVDGAAPPDAMSERRFPGQQSNTREKSDEIGGHLLGATSPS
jgi:hypothetical protein